MLRGAREIRKFRIAAEDREIGEVRDTLFDDNQWTVRYLTVRTGHWLSGREVLLSPQAVRSVDDSAETVAVNVTAEQIRNSPDISAELPVSRQDEAQLLMYFNWMPSWQMSGPEAPGPNIYPSRAEMTGLASPQADEPKIQPPPEDLEPDPRLRSAEAVTGYRIHARDDEFGSVDDLIVDLDHWAVRYFAIDTRRWLPSASTLIGVDWIDAIDHGERVIRTSIEKDVIKNAPEYDSDKPLTRAIEAQLHEHYGRQGYWPD